MRAGSWGRVALALCVAPATGAAQQRSQPNLVLTMFAGVVTGGALWTIDKQPLLVLGTEPNPQYDTLRLGRETTPSIAAGAAMTYFPTPAFGVQADLAYLGLPLGDACTGLFYNPDPAQRNAQICDDIQGQAHSAGAVSLLVSAIARAAPHGSTSPYLRAGIGLVTYNHSTIEVSGAFMSGGSIAVREVILDNNPRRTSVSAVLAAGATFPLSPGYQFRLEVRDVIVNLQRAAGPANALAQAPVASRYYHHAALTMGLDVVLEKKRGRRY